jgi:aminobenzoyl-glutamate utilization protein B
MLGEYDALPDCGKKKGTYGHGCGHNLLGVAPAVGAVTISKILEEKNIPGKIVYWGCPAEETLVGKAYMARDGGFKNMDVCLCWHPSSRNTIKTAGGAALDSFIFEFKGRTSHAAGSPHKGRSALDSAILMDVAVNYLREHVPENVRIHSVICDGGKAPNVVPEYSKIWYYVRGRNRAQVDEISHRLTLCAKGAAIATETEMTVTKITSIYNFLPNQALAEIIKDNFQLFGPPKIGHSDIENIKALGKEPLFSTNINTNVVAGEPGRASSDESTVSWLSPLGGFGTACVSQNTIFHNRDFTMQGNLPFAHKGMMKAAELFAGTAFDLFTDKNLLRKVVKEFKSKTKDFKFDPLLLKQHSPDAGS